MGSEADWGEEFEAFLAEEDTAVSAPPCAGPQGCGGGEVQPAAQLGPCQPGQAADQGAAAGCSSPDAGGASGGGEPPAKRQRLETGPLLPPAPAAIAGARSCSGSRPPAPPAAGGGLAGLTEPLLLRTCCFLSPEDICTLGRTSRLFRTACADASLWRRLYFLRWPEGPKNGEQEEDESATAAVDWKLLYRERDHVELAQSLQGAPAPLKPLYAQMATAKRSECLGVQHTEQLFRPPRTPHHPGTRAGGRSGAGGRGEGLSAQEVQQQVADAIEAFRRPRGLTDPALHAVHVCGDGECRGFAHLEPWNVWVCASTGYVHRCGANCSEREVDPAACGNLVCPISGRCFDRMMSDDECEAAAAERGGDEQRGEEDWQADEGINGRLGRAFYAGYYATDERELIMHGIRWA